MEDKEDTEDIKDMDYIKDVEVMEDIETRIKRRFRGQGIYEKYEEH